MKRLGTVAGLAAKFSLSLALCCTSAWAAFSNPDPVNYGDDVGASYFSPQTFLNLVKAYDPLAPTYGTAFGFYRAGLPLDSANASILSNSLDPIGFVTGVDFSSGVVVDVGAGTVRGTFAPGTQAIGFYLYVAPPSGSPFALFSDPAANAALGIGDVFAAFPSRSQPGQYLLEFAVPSSAPGGATIVSLVVGGPLAPVPEPGELALLLSGLLVVTAAVRARQRHRS